MSDEPVPMPSHLQDHRRVTLSKEFVGQISAMIREEAAMIREAAALAGRNDDGGAAQMEAQLEAWICGLSQTVPKAWASKRDRIRAEADPDWAEWERLKAKFGDIK